jgi:hypothetical protein
MFGGTSTWTAMATVAENGFYWAGKTNVVASVRAVVNVRVIANVP